MIAVNGRRSRYVATHTRLSLSLSGSGIVCVVRTVACRTTYCIICTCIKHEHDILAVFAGSEKVFAI